jgi:hypothetical protein
MANDCGRMRLGPARSWLLRTLMCVMALVPAIAVASRVWALPSCPVSPSTITSCCVADQAGQTYSLGANISATGECIDISAPKILLQLNGFTITGPAQISGTIITGGVGIGIHVLSTAPNLTIFSSSGGTVRQFATGFQSDAPNTVVLDLTCFLNIRGCVFNGAGAWASYIYATGNSKNGIVMTPGASGSFALELISSFNGSNGIVLNGTTGVTLWSTTAENNAGYGLWLKSASFNSIFGGHLEGNTLAGAYLGCHADGPSSTACSTLPSHGNTIGGSVTVGSGCGPGSQPYGIAIDSGNRRNHVTTVFTDRSCSGSADTIDDGFDGNGATCAGNFWDFNSFITMNSIPSSSHPFCID